MIFAVAGVTNALAGIDIASPNSLKSTFTKGTTAIVVAGTPSYSLGDSDNAPPHSCTVCYGDVDWRRPADYDYRSIAMDCKQELFTSQGAYRLVGELSFLPLHEYSN